MHVPAAGMEGLHLAAPWLESSHRSPCPIAPCPPPPPPFATDAQLCITAAARRKRFELEPCCSMAAIRPGLLEIPPPAPRVLAKGAVGRCWWQPPERDDPLMSGL